MHRPQPPLAQLHYFAPESEEEKRLRLELGFTTSTDESIETDQMNANVAPITSIGYARPSVMVSKQDTNQPFGTFETSTAPAPSTNDLALRTQQTSQRQAIPHAMITTPPDPAAPVISIASLPPTADAQADEKRAMDSTAAPLQAASFLGYPEIPKSTSPNEEVLAANDARVGGSNGKGEGNEKAILPEQALQQAGDDDDDDEPLPEMDSDMDLSDDEGDEDDYME